MALELRDLQLDQKKNTRYAVYISLVVLAYLIFVSLNTPGYTGDTGDSIAHYLYAKYSWQHPEYFFNMWAKPIFTALSSPFAQFGFDGMKVFNSIVVSAVLFLSSRLAISLQLRSWFLVPPMIIFSAVYGVNIFSGLTEYLYSLMMLGVIYAAWKEKYILAAILASFIPFARNEGVLVIMLLGVFCVWRRQFKALPFLVTGYLAMGVIGAIVMDYSIFWAFTERTYDSQGTPYGKGEFWVFIRHLRYVMEWPNVVLICLGLLALILDIFKVFGKERRTQLIIILIYGNFIGFYVGHAILHEVGRYGSMGLPRVLFSVAPLAAIVGLIGLNWVLSHLPKNFRTIIIPILLIYIIAYPHFPRQKSHLWSGKRTLNIPEVVLANDELTPYLQSLGKEKDLFYFNMAYLSIPLDVNGLKLIPNSIFISKREIKETPPGSVYIWDSWYSLAEGGITKELLVESQFREDKCFEVSYWVGTVQFCVFIKDD